MQRKLISLVIILLLIFSLTECKKKIKDSMKNSHKKHKNHQEAHHFLTPDTLEFWLNALLATFLSLAGGFCSGMTVGLNSLSILNLQIMLKGQDPKNKKIAQRILGVIHDHHLFLVTLLVGNAIVLQSLPLVIHLIMPDWAAILFSTVIVLIVAEVVPMSLSTGTHKYIIAYYGAPLVGLLIKLFWPICYPIARGLDALLGTQHQQRILRRDFLTFINDKQKNFLQKLQIQFINQVMNYKNKNIKEIMIPKQKAFMLQQNQIINENIIREISKREYSIIPIYHKNIDNIIGYINTKEIILNYLNIKNNEEIALKKLVKGKIILKVIKVYYDAIATQALGVLQANKCQILLVSNKQKHIKTSQKQNENQSMISIYTDSQWIQRTNQSYIGFVTLYQILHQIADYKTQTLKKLHRKLSNQPQQQPQI